MEDSGTDTGSSLLTKLQSSFDLSSIHSLFSSYLHPFSAFLNKPYKDSESSKIDAETAIILRSLAKKFLPFLNKTLSILPKRLTGTPKIESCHASELFETYKLCLDCLAAVSSQLACKPYSIQIQRVRLIHCYENWGRYEDAQIEGFSVLEFIGNFSGKRKGRVVPEVGKENVDKDVALLIVDVVVTLVKCVTNCQRKDKEEYLRVLSMVDEIQPWLRVIDADACEKLHKMLVTYLSKCALFLVGELASIDVKLAHRFCVVTFSEFSKLSLKDQMEKFGRRICSSFFSQLDEQFLFSVEILTCVLDAMAHECKIGKENRLVYFLELADCCAINCRNATADFCSAVATHFNKLASDFSQVNLSPVDLILRIYAIALSIGDLNFYSRGRNPKMLKAVKDISIPKILLKMEDHLQSLTTTYGSLTRSYKISAEELGLSVSEEFKNLASQRHLLLEANNEGSITAHNGRAYMSQYFTALKFLCEPLCELILSERTEILSGLEDISFPKKLPNIQDALHQFGLVFLTYRASERERDVYDENSRALLTVAVAAFTLSFTTKQNVKETTNFLRHVISAEWVQANGLKYLFVSLHNVGIVLYRSNRLKEASKSLKLCCQAAWNRVLHLCKMFVQTRDGFSSDMSEDAIAGFVSEACAQSAFLLDMLYQCGSNKISRILTDCLASWSVAQGLFDKIPSPVALVKQWAKIECKQIKDPEAEHTIPTLYSLMSSSSKISKQSLGILLEQELQAYKEMISLNPKLCKIMQMTITNILLQEIYSTKDNYLQKSRILVANARESRASGVEGLNDSIKYISEAISTVIDLYDKSKGDRGQVCHLLAEAYCLRALFSQDAEPDSKNFIQDIDNALKLWLNEEHSQSAEQMHNSLTLLYYVADLLSIKGYTESHSDIYEMMIRVYKLKNVSVHEYLAMLWQSRSLSHALCASPVNDAFIMTLSKHCNLSNSMEFWISCMERLKSLKVGFQQSLLAISTLSSDSYNHDNAVQPHITVDEVKQAASDLINSVSLSSNSFLAAHLYYDLSERMIARGLMFEALSYAKEAHHLLGKLLQKNFMYSVEQQNDIIDVNGEVIQKCGYTLKAFHMHPSVATAAWSNETRSRDFEDCILTPWSVLRCYLESTLQMGTIHEVIGNGSDAETLLLWGKNISLFQGLPIFIVSFSFALGKLYRKQQLWHLAEKELESAKHILADNCSLLSCLKCRLVLEVTVDQQLGDLFRSRFNSNTVSEVYEGLLKAEKFYRSAADKLKLSEWKNCVSNPNGASEGSTMLCDVLFNDNKGVSISSDCTQEVTKPKVTRKNKKAAKPFPEEQKMSYRMTRSRVKSSKKSEDAKSEVQNDVSKFSERKQVYACPDALIGKAPQKVDCISACGCEVPCICDEVKCWHCLPSEIMKSSSLRSIIQIKWECIRRRLLLRLLTGIGKCLGVRGEIQRAHEAFLESISVLVCRSTYHSSHLSISVTFLAELIEKNVVGNAFAIEHASILYNICWFSLKGFCGKDIRDQCNDLSSLPIPIVLSALKLSFILCREVPGLFQKVSRLLAVLYTLSPSNKIFSSSSNALSESQWASYFHQASLGTRLSHQLFSHIGKQKDHNTMDVDGSSLPSSTSLSSLRLAPESVLDLEGFILKFFQDLPNATIVCISMLGDGFASFLKEISPHNPSTQACILLSRFNSDGLPVVIVLPVDSVVAGSQEEGEDSSCSFLFDGNNPVKPWHCPWGHTIVDEVAPLFKKILEENYISSSKYPMEDTKKNRSLWWTRRRKLDQGLGDFLRDMEDLWFGPWKRLLLGQRSDCNHLNFVVKKLKKDLKSKCKVDVHGSILNVILEHASQQEESLSELILNKGCYIGGTECRSDEIDDLSSLVSELVLNAIHEIGDEDFVDREPVILVLDFDIQMLPWENMPILRNQEIYRMPSVASISSTLDRCSHDQEKIGKDSEVFPMIDPLDAYYLLNPGGDLSHTEAEFGNWFKDQNLKGTAGTSPSVDELSMALKKHDLFIYFGHGSGTQYIPGNEIQKLNKCAATLLMGCSSGSLSLKGSYTPKGAPIYYLSAGSPVIVANLWEVTDKDIDRFGKSMLDAWIKARSDNSMNCPQCDEVLESFRKLNIEDKRKGKKKITRKKSFDACEVNVCRHRPKIGSFMGRAREACTLPFLIGAAPVCYGVPTGIKKKDL